MSIRRYFATSNHATARIVRVLFRRLQRLSMPCPHVILRFMLFVFLVVRNSYYFLFRIFVCEPLFKACCEEHGKNLHTGACIPRLQGKGRIIAGDNVIFHGRCSFAFAARFCEQPTLDIGDNSRIGHDSAFVIAKRIAIGCDCRIGSGVTMFDSNGHPLDPVKRRDGAPPSEKSIRPITVLNNVWIGRQAMILPGVTIGCNSIIAAASVVREDVPANCIVAGNPAKVVKYLIDADQMSSLDNETVGCS